MEAVHSSKTMVTTYKITWFHKPEDIYSKVVGMNMTLKKSSYMYSNVQKYLWDMF